MLRFVLVSSLTACALALPGSAAAAVFPESFNVIGVHDDTFYGLDVNDKSIVRWINKRTGAAGSMSVGGPREDIMHTGWLSQPDNRTVFSSSGLAVGPPNANPVGHPRQLYRVTRGSGFKVLATLAPWSSESCGPMALPLHISEAGEVLTVETVLTRAGGFCAATGPVRLMRYDESGTASEVPVPRSVHGDMRWGIGPMNIVAAGRYAAVANRISKSRPQSRLTILDTRNGRVLSRLSAAPRGYNAQVEFATSKKLLVFSRTRGRRSQLRHIGVNGSVRLVKRGKLPDWARPCGSRTVMTDRSYGYWIYGADGHLQRRIPSDSLTEPYALLCSARHLYFGFGPYDEIGAFYDGLVDLSKLR